MGPSEDLQRKLELVVQTGLLLAKSSDLETIVQAATDAGRELCGAQFGAFFYNVINAQGESYLLYTLSGVERETFSNFPMPRNTAVFAPTFNGEGIVRSDDITRDPRYGQNAPHYGKPKGHLPVRSYLAIPVQGQSGEVLGGLFYGHEEIGVFEQDSEDMVATVAAQAAIAIENARLRDQQKQKIVAAEKETADQTEIAGKLNEIAAIVASSNDAILSKDLTGIIRSWNPAATRILGYTAEEMIGQPVLRLIPSELQHEEPKILEKIRSGVRIEHFETVRVTKSGERINVSLTISPLYDGSGTIVGASKILRDISSKTRAEESLLQAAKMAAAGRMAATIAHEVNNPLEAVTNLLFLAKTNADDPMQVREYITTAESEVARVSHLAKQTLGFYREHAHPVETDIGSLIEEAVLVYRRKCEQAGITLRLDLRSTHTLIVRKGEMMQVISNLIANAIYAMPQGGTLSIATEDAAGNGTPGTKLTITDTGVGIAEENLDRIFEAFFTTRAAIGTGIGLFVAKQFVEGHQGTIAVESSVDAANHGTRFTIFLPKQGTVSHRE
jgi:PAS domain S-box-containing protein